MRCLKFGCRTQRAAFASLAQRLSRLSPSDRIAERREELFRLRRRLGDSTHRLLLAAQTRSAQAAARLKLLSPDNVLSRGYSITTNAVSGAVVRDARRVSKGQRLRVRLHRGEISAVTEEVNPR